MDNVYNVVQCHYKETDFFFVKKILFLFLYSSIKLSFLQRIFFFMVSLRFIDVLGYLGKPSKIKLIFLEGGGGLVR